MIAPTEQDIGRRVRLASVPDTVGTLASIDGCAVCKECVMVHYEGSRYRVATDPEKLQWADESLL